jgi:hypothetical protein
MILVYNGDMTELRSLTRNMITCLFKEGYGTREMCCDDKFLGGMDWVDSPHLDCVIK